MGFKESLIKWFQLYLTNRKLFVTLESVRCWTNKLRCSTRIYLRLLLFLIYISDLPQALNETGSYLYADNTCIFYQDRDVEKIEKVLNNEFSSLCEQFIDNKLSIHSGDDKAKTNFFLSNEKLTKTKHIIWRLLSKTAEYCRKYWMLP